MGNENTSLTTPDLRIVLIGIVGEEKSSVMKVFLRSTEKKAAPESESLCSPVAETFQKQTLNIGGQKVVVVNTPGLCDPNKENKDVMKEIKQCVSLAAPGPHVFLLVLPLGPFTDELRDMVKIIKDTFGDCVIQYTMVLFPQGENLGDTQDAIREFIESNKELTKFVEEECKKRYHVLHSTAGEPEVTQLLQKIQTMVTENKPEYYTAESAALKKRIALSVNGSGVVGAGLGGAVSHFVGSSIGIPAGIAAGAAVGMVVGGVGLAAVERRKKGCAIQ